MIVLTNQQQRKSGGGQNKYLFLPLSPPPLFLPSTTCNRVIPSGAKRNEESRVQLSPHNRNEVCKFPSFGGVSAGRSGCVVDTRLMVLYYNDFTLYMKVGTFLLSLRQRL
ncbi:MAG: hypothetical protein PHQ33_08290 [Bacteroidales bacterium]|nr:hypothetical protein [Bacteroidales bacterium]